MANSNGHSSDIEQTRIQHLLNCVGNGDEQALDELLRLQCERLTRLARRMLNDYPRVRRWAETGDVLQNALVRLTRALRDLKPQSPGEFLGLAALQIRRELIDLARSFHGPRGVGANHDSPDPQRGVSDPADVSHEPSSLAQWSELHEHIGKLPADERAVVDLLLYQGLPQQEAAAVLGVSVRTVQRYWHSALWKLHQVWKGESPS